MPDDIDESLLASPLDDDRQSRRAVIFGSVAALLVAAAVAVWLFPGDDDTGIRGVEAAPESVTVVDDTAAADTTGAAEAPEVVLWPYEPDPPILYHPTELPRGWEACRVVEDSSRGDRFCDRDGDEAFVQVSVKEAGDVRSDAAPPTGDDYNGVWLDRGASNDVGYRRGMVWVVVRSDDALPAATLVEIAASIPAVSDFDSLYGTYEAALALEEISDGDLAALLSEFDPEPRVVRRDGEANVYAGDVSLYGFYADGHSVPDFAWSLPQPRLIPADRPIVVGVSSERNRAYAVWDQAGFGWRLEGRMTADEIAALAYDLVECIAALPTRQ
ncbi:MAG: hypothetical protein U9N78_08170 [Actinomycetota bacterium]|nr:hypothetical protein [Actinomycetota bacterium]